MLKKILAAVLRFLHREEILLRIADHLDPVIVDISADGHAHEQAT